MDLRGADMLSVAKPISEALTCTAFDGWMPLRWDFVYSLLADFWTGRKKSLNMGTNDTTLFCTGMHSKRRRSSLNQIKTLLLFAGAIKSMIDQ